MESLDREFVRQSRRLDPNSTLKPVEVYTVADIKAVLSEFDPAKNKIQTAIPISTNLVGVDNEGKQSTFYVSAETKSRSKRDLLIEGLDLIKSRIEVEKQIADSDAGILVNGKLMKPASLGNSVHGLSWVDPLIKQWLGASREGITIYWDLQDGYRYEYNIYEHKLSRICYDEAESG
jgi:hypothetical protein